MGWKSSRNPKRGVGGTGGALRTALRALPFRSLAICAALCASALLLANEFDRHYPIEEWLFWRYLGSWGGTLFFCASCLSIGNLLRALLSPGGGRSDGNLVLSFSTGVYAFFLTTFAFGLCGWLRPVAFWLIPGSLLLLGLPRLLEDYTPWRWHASGLPVLDRFSRWEVLGFAAGVIGVVALYLPILVPENAAFDSRWYHLGLAEQYAAEGAIRRFPEGPLAATVPHLASVIYAWAFLVPGGQLFDRLELAAHVEFAVFLFTLASVPPLVRHVVPSASARLAWVAMLLFPSVFLYDSGLFLAADHIAALFAIPAYLFTVRALRDLHPGVCALFAVQLCGLAMTKYTAVTAALLPVLALAATIAWHAFRRVFWRKAPRRMLTRRLVVAPAVVLGAGLVLSSPHWLKNWLWYGDPLYPVLHRHLNVRPWIPEGDLLFELYKTESWTAAGSAALKLSNLLRALVDHSYKLYNWVDFHGYYPIFGSLFTFGLVALPFLKGTRRLWLLVVAVHLGVAAWFLLFHHDRYLQVLLPWMAAGTAAIAILCWRAGWAARAAVLLLGAVQLVWGLDLIFWPLHRVTGTSGIAAAAAFFAQAYSKQYTARIRPFSEHANIGRAMPPGSRLLIHHEHARVGYGVPATWDWSRFQYGISYGSLGSSAAVHRRLRELGITHVLWARGRVYGDESLATDLVFHGYASRYLVNSKHFGARELAEVPSQEPPAERPVVFSFSCSGPLPNGIFALAALRSWPLKLPGAPPPTPPTPLRRLEGNAGELLALADWAVIDSACAGAPNAEGFTRVAAYGTRAYYARGAP